MKTKKKLATIQEFKKLLIDAATGKNWDEGDFAIKYDELRTKLISQTEIQSYLPDFLWDCKELGDFWNHISKKLRTYRERRAYLSKEFEQLLDYLGHGRSLQTYSSILKKKLIMWLIAGGDNEVAEKIDQCRFYAFEDEGGEVQKDGTQLVPIAIRIYAQRDIYDQLSNKNDLLRKKVISALQTCISGSRYFKRIVLEALVVDTPLESSTFEEISLSSETVMISWRKLLNRQQTDKSGAITAARTLVEDVCKLILDDLNASYTSKEDLSSLYKKTTNELSLAPKNHNEKIYKQILGGCNSVIGGIAALRNALGDSHGKGEKSPRPLESHSQLTVNLAATMALFLIETHKNSQKPKSQLNGVKQYKLDQKDENRALEVAAIAIKH